MLQQLFEHGGQGPPLWFYFIVALSLMSAVFVGRVAIAGYKPPAPEYFPFQVAHEDKQRREHTLAFASWRGS